MDTIDSIILKTQELIKAYSDPERIALSKWYYPTSMKVYGMASASIKEIIREIKKDIKETCPENLKDIAVKLTALGVFECQQLAYGILNRNFSVISTLSYQEIMLLGTTMDNWVSTDSFSTQVAGPAWRLGVLNNDHIVGWAGSDDFWWRRNALVTTVGLNLKSQGGSGDAPRTIMICELLVDDKNDMVIKAMSWALRELSKHDRRAVGLFLSEFSDRLASRVKREVNKKLITGRKNG